MSLVFAAITPHPPFLIPSIGKEQLDKIQRTREAMELLEQELYIAKPQVIIIISPHGSLFTDSFAVNAHTHFVSAFDEFGDLTTKKEWHGTPELAAKIAHEGKQRNFPLQLVSRERLDHGAAVALYYLTNHLPEIKVIPMGYSDLDVKTHLAFGELLKDVIMTSDKRIAVIASGDLSHHVSTDPGANLSDSGKRFDHEFMTALEEKNLSALTGLNPDLIAQAEECGYRSALILLGILERMQYTFKTYSYECPFGIGYLVGNFVL